MRAVLHYMAGVVAGTVGFFAGLFTLLSVSGLEHAGSAPIVTLGGAALTGTLAVTLLAKLPAATTVGLSLGAAGLGVIVGSLLDFAGDSYDLSIISGLILIAAATYVSRSIAADRESSVDRREPNRFDPIID